MKKSVKKIKRDTFIIFLFGLLFLIAAIRSIIEFYFTPQKSINGVLKSYGCKKSKKYGSIDLIIELRNANKYYLGSYLSCTNYQYLAAGDELHILVRGSNLLHMESSGRTFITEEHSEVFNERKVPVFVIGTMIFFGTVIRNLYVLRRS